jgi:hypothetical protein
MSRDHAIAHELTNHILHPSPAPGLRSPGAPGNKTKRRRCLAEEYAASRPGGREATATQPRAAGTPSRGRNGGGTAAPDTGGAAAPDTGGGAAAIGGGAAPPPSGAAAACAQQGGYGYTAARCWYAIARPQRRRRSGPGYRRRRGPGYRGQRRSYRRGRRSSRRGHCSGLRAAVEFVARWRRHLRHRGRLHRFHAVPVRTKLPKEPPESAAPAPLSSRTNGLHITLLMFYTYHVHYCSYANYVN